MADATLHATVFNLSRPGVATTFPLPDEVFLRRVELAAQQVPLPYLGTTLAGGSELRLRATCLGQTGTSGRMRLATCRVEALAADDTLVAARDIPMSAILLMEAQALVEALSAHHNIFLPGERAATHLYATDGALPELPEFTYLVPECDLSVTATEATLTARAGAIISEMASLTSEAEQRAFAVGCLGVGAVPMVTDVIIPPGEAEGAGPATVQFSPEDWAYAQDVVAALGPPFRILGPCHTHPYGGVTPSPVDWDLFMWSAGAEGLFVIAGAVGRQATAAGYRWINGSLQQVNLQVEDADEAVDAPDQEVRACRGYS
jgi:hypothetical protein